MMNEMDDEMKDDMTGKFLEALVNHLSQGMVDDVKSSKMKIGEVEEGPHDAAPDTHSDTAGDSDTGEDGEESGEHMDMEEIARMMGPKRRYPNSW